MHGGTDSDCWRTDLTNVVGTIMINQHWCSCMIEYVVREWWNNKNEQRCYNNHQLGCCIKSGFACSNTREQPLSIRQAVYNMLKHDWTILLFYQSCSIMLTVLLMGCWTNNHHWEIRCIKGTKGSPKDHQGIIKGSSALTFCRFIWNSFSASCSSIASGIVKASAAAIPATALSAPPLLYSPFFFSGVNVANSGTVLRAAGERLLENIKCFF